MAGRIEQIAIPDIGDADEVEVIELCVAPGASVEPEDSLIVIESDKASMDIPSPLAGTLIGFKVELGDQVTTGQIVAEIEVVGDAPVESADTSAPAAADTPDTPDVPVPAMATPEPPAAPAADARHEVVLPDVGDAGEVVVIELGAAVGDQVSAEQMLLVVESDKASMDIVAPVAGELVELRVGEGAEVTEGMVLAVIRPAAGAAAAAAEPVAASSSASAAAEPPPPPAAPAPPAPEPGQIVAAPAPQRDASGLAPPPERVAPPQQAKTIYAGPAVRRLARELGVDLSAVGGSGARGRIVKDDVHAYVKARLAEPAGRSSGAGGSGIPAVPQIDHSRFGTTNNEAMTRIQRRGAANLHASWLNVVHVTQHDEADVTELEAFRKSLKAEGEQRGIKITPLAFIMKACAHLMGEFPRVNSSLDEAVESFIVKDYVNIGFAVDTPDGLVVPVVRDADKLGVWELADAINVLAAKARDKKLAPADMQGGTFTISSLGAIGGTGFTPIVNAPEVAILGVAKLATKPQWDGSAFVPRKMLPLSFSYDHRALNGADAGRFVTALSALLTDLRRVAL